MRPELYGETGAQEWLRLLLRKTIDLEKNLNGSDVLLVPDFYHDARTDLLPRVIAKTRCYSVAIFHDAAALALPTLADRDRKKFHNYLRSLATFDLVICISRESRDDLLQRWRDDGVLPTQTVIEPWPVEFEPEARNGYRSSEPIAACISSFEPRKNHFTLLRAAEKLWSRGARFELQLVGRTSQHSAPKMISSLWQMRRNGRPLRWLRHINDDALHQVYRSCRFTVYPSLMEGFGLPIAESLWHGKPVICGGNGALGEVARGGGCLILDQASPDAIALGMKTLLSDQQLYSRLCEEARSRTFRSWSDYTDKLLAHHRVQSQSAINLPRPNSVE
jgi:glycosyltransferase involved in cell wall biosynthesis